MRRRLRYLRSVRELSYRDLGGLMFDLHRFGGRRDELLIAKLSRLSELDTELRAIEKALEDREPVTVLREAGVLACLRCAAIHSSEDNFCPHCGLSVSREAERPLTTAPETPPGASPAAANASTPTPAAQPAPAAQPGATPPPTSRASAPGAGQQQGPPPPSGQPAAAQPSVTRQAPVAARLASALPSDPEATGLMPPIAPAPPASDQGTPGAPGTGAQEGKQDGDGASASDASAESPAAGTDRGDESARGAEPPTQVIPRPERPEGSTAG